MYINHTDQTTLQAAIGLTIPTHTDLAFAVAASHEVLRQAPISRASDQGLRLVVSLRAGCADAALATTTAHRVVDEIAAISPSLALDEDGRIRLTEAVDIARLALDDIISVRDAMVVSLDAQNKRLQNNNVLLAGAHAAVERASSALRTTALLRAAEIDDLSPGPRDHFRSPDQDAPRPC